ncbi:MAG: OmpA family protein [Endomicrobia bacterium]|nr:OmpA family protein [Endomicrobiia bacterium]
MVKKLFFLGFMFLLCSSVAYSQSMNNDLFLANESTGTRTFNLTPGTYNIDASLGNTGTGDFTVTGGGTPADYILSGVLVSTDGTVIGTNGSFFKISSASTSLVLQGVTVSSAGTAVNGSVLVLNNATSSALITNVILEDNMAATNGGAIHSLAGSLTLSNSILRDNSSGSNGGALNNASQAIISSSVFSNNTAFSNAGAIYNTGTVTLDDSLFELNTAVNGGAVYNAGVLNLGNITMDSNETTGGSGGAIYNLGPTTASPARINILGNTVIQNNTSDTDGGGIYNNRGIINVSTASGGFLSFISNESLGGSGGAIINYGTVNLSSAVFTGNKALSEQGGAVYNGTAGQFNFGYVLFDSNQSLDGGAIYSISGNITSLAGSYVEFLSNTAAGNGGAIYVHGGVLSGTTTSHFLSLKGETVFTNNSAQYGGAVYNDSIDPLSGVYIGGPTLFNGNSAAVQGGAIYNAGVFYLDSSLGDIIFTGNTAAGFSNDIYNDSSGKLYINADSNNVIVNGGIAGQSLNDDYGIFKTGSGSLLINGDSSSYYGNFFMTDGQVTVSSGFFVGNTEITGGILDLVQGGNITTGIIRIYESGVMNIDTDSDLIFSGQFLGDPDSLAGGTLTKTASSTGSLTFVGAYLNRAIDVFGGVIEASTGTSFWRQAKINLNNGTGFLITTPGDLYLYDGGLSGDNSTYATKTGAGTLYISGDNSGFTGTYDQYAGTTTVLSFRGNYGIMFTGINNIYDSILNVTQSPYTRNTVSIGYDVNLFDNAQSNYYNRTVAATYLDSANVTFMGNNSTAFFGKAREYVRKAQYILNGQFSDLGSGNSVTFSDSIVTFTSNTYTGLSYLFDISIFDLTAGNSTSTVTFDNLSLSGSNGIMAGVNFVDTGGSVFNAVADQLHTNTLTDTVYLFDTVLYSGANNLVSSGTYYAQVLYGGLTFDASLISTFTVIRPYNTFNLSIDPSRLTEIMIDVIVGFDRHSLYSRNAESGSRGFAMSVEGTYNIDMSLSDTQAGWFVVKGGDGVDTTASKYVISGDLLNGSNGSFFNLVNATNFDLQDITVEDAYSSDNGSVLKISTNTASAVFANVILQNNSSVNNGGAIYAQAGEVYIDSVTAAGNSADAGGVFYFSDDVIVKFDNSSYFTGNSASSGGVIYAVDVSSKMVIDNSTILFSSNNADSGGAIYSSNSSFELSESRITFSSNTASLGGAIYLDSSNIDFIIGNISFSGNEASSGGAIYAGAGQSQLNFTGLNTTNFVNNSAASGGAIAVVGSTLSMNLSLAHVLFNGNSSAKGNDIYMEDSVLNISIASISALWTDTLTLQGGMYVETAQNTINKTGAGIFTLMGDNYIQGDFNVSGGRFNVTNADYAHENGTFTLDQARGMYVSGSTMSFSSTADVFFTNNSYDENDSRFDGSYGGALTLSSGSVVTFGGNASFINNVAYSSGGAAIYNTGGSTLSFANVNALFSNNISSVNGGAILNDAASVLSLLGNIDFSNNRALGSGGAISNAANATLTADSSSITFTGNTATTYGGAIYNTGTLNLNTLNNGYIVFSGTTAASRNTASGAANDIYNAAGAVINIGGDSGGVVVNGGIRGSGTINKSGGNTLFINANSSSYNGRFVQTGGLTFVTSNYFTGVSSITAGVLELSTGTVLAGGTIGIYDPGIMNITTPGNLTFSGNVTGNGYINKTSAGTLTLSGNNSVFNGVYTQTAGTTTVNVTGRMFGGVNNISSSTLIVTGSGATLGYNVNLGSEGISKYYNDPTITVISTANITFTGNNALAYFDNSSSLGKAYYQLDGPFANSGTGNEVAFNNSYVTFGSDNFNNNVLYSFSNSTVSISNSLSGPGSTRTVTFDDIAVSGSTLDFGVTFDGTTVDNDKLTVASSTGSFDLGLLLIKHDNDLGLSTDTHRLHVLDGIEFVAGGMTDIATSVYEYEARVDDSDKRDVILTITGFADPYSLDRQNMKFNTRAFIWSYAGDYHEGNSLHNMSSGTFYVLGYSGDASESLLSGVLAYSTNTTTGRGSFFNIDNNTQVDFYLSDLTVSSAQANGEYSGTLTRTDSDGSVIRLMSDFATVNVSNVVFDDNEAFNNGGVICSGAGVMNISSSVFTNNKAGGDGGAMYVTQSTVNLNTNSGDILFEGNTANGADNDIYLGDYANLNIIGIGNTVISGGILSDISSSGIEVNKTDSGTVYLGGINKVYGRFNVDGGTLKLVDNASYDGKELAIAAGGSLDMYNGYANTINLETFETEGNITIDIFDNNTNDVIYADDAYITGGNIDVMVASGTYLNNRYYLIIATDSVTGRFASSSLSEPLRYRLFYDSNNVWLDVNYMYVSTFSKLSPLTFNQSETARAIDTISLNPSIEWGALIDHLMWDLNEQEQLYVLSHLSGYFLANVVRNAAADIPSKQIFDKIRNHDEKDITSSGLWVQLRGNREIWYGDENSLGHYKDTSFGAMVGFDRYIDEKGRMYGVYAGFSKDDIKQELNEADGTRGSLGVYGGFFNDGWEIKGLLLGSMDTFDTRREVLGSIAEGTIDAITVSADAEGALKFELTERTAFRPFVGIDAANVNYKAFDETGAGMYNLNVSGGNYFRSSARIGAGIEHERKKWFAYTSAEARYLITGNKPEVESVFVNTDIDFRSRGTTEGTIAGGLNAGVEAKVTENLRAFANANVTAADRYGYYGGNIGVRYVFGRRNALLERYLIRAHKLAESAYGDSIKVQNFMAAEKYEEAREYATSGLNDADQAFDLTEIVAAALTDDKHMTDSQRAAIEQRVVNIESTAKRARDRIIHSLYDIRELEEAKDFIGEAEKHLSAADEAKRLNASSNYIVQEGKLAIMAADQALEKTDKAQEKLDHLTAAEARAALVEAEKALQRTDAAQNRLNALEGVLSKNDVAVIAANIEQLAESAREIKNRAEQLIEAEEKEAKRANERRVNPGAQMISLHTASFRVDEAILSAEDEKKIAEVALNLRKRGFNRITIEGHTDNTGSHEHNLYLSHKRAAVVKDKLIEHGIPKEKITHVGFAATMPVKSNETKEGRAANRRTEIFIE